MKKLLFSLLAAAAALGQGQPEINAVMMQSTFRLEGAAAANQRSLGTAFIVGRPIANAPDRAQYVLVTAAHVLDSFGGDNALLFIRRKDAEGRWQEAPVPLSIRSNSRAMWVHHPGADVAAMYVALPQGAVPSLVSTNLFADDKALTDYEVHPGDELNVLGYPLGYQGPGGFPVLRSGKIASYPLTPVKQNPYFLLDFRVFQGNSGGPVYMVSHNRSYGGGTHIGGVVQMVLGLVSEEVAATEETRSIYENRSQRYPLGLAKIVPAALIRETIDLLPEPRD